MVQTVTRVNGSSTMLGKLYSPNTNFFIITVKNAASVAKNLSTEDTNGTDAVIDGAIENIVREISPLAWLTDGNQTTNTGKIYIVTDISINSAADVQLRLRRLGSVGPNLVDISGTEVVEATSMIFS